MTVGDDGTAVLNELQHHGQSAPGDVVPVGGRTRERGRGLGVPEATGRDHWLQRGYWL